ncbi:MAG: hypothetical protein WAW88_13680 [Nocardioides sp.]
MSVAALLGAVAAITAVLVNRGVGPLPDPEECVATVGDHTVEITVEQAENAALITAISVRRGLPARAASIALATAFQESKLLNLEYGDRDSLGLFQQRPSQGWGTRKQILNPVFATNAFYDALERVPGYTELRITEAAQRVQRSAYPEAYEAHAQDARVLASALTGETTGGGFHCVVQGWPTETRTQLDRTGLTARAGAVRREVRRIFGDQSWGGFAPGGVTSGHMPGSAHYEGRAIDILLRPVSAANRRQGWAIAGYLVAQADRLEIAHVIYDGRIWSRGSRSEQGWRDYTPPAGSSGDQDVLDHRDHVHVDVAP